MLQDVRRILLRLDLINIMHGNRSVLMGVVVSQPADTDVGDWLD